MATKFEQKASPKHDLDRTTSYLKSHEARWFWLTIGILATTVAAVFVIPDDLYPWIYGRYFLGGLFVLWFPGYTLVRALFPEFVPSKGAEENLGMIERAALSVGMSLAIVPVLCLLLNSTPWGIRLVPLIFGLAAITLVFATGALMRESRSATTKHRAASVPIH